MHFEREGNLVIRPGPACLWIVLVILVASASMGQVEAQGQERAADSEQLSLAPRQFDLIHRTLRGVHDELKAADPDIAADTLRGRLLIEAYELINNVMNSGLSHDRLLLLPDSLKEDASRLVSVVLEDERTEDPGADQGPLLIDDSSIPVRLRPFQPILAEVLADRFEHLKASILDPATLRKTFQQEAIEMAARAISPSDDPRDLVEAERDYVVALASGIAGGDLDPPDNPDPADNPLLQDELDGIAELLRRKNAEWKISGEWSAIKDRIDRLGQFGMALLEESLQRRDPEASIPISAREQIRAMAEVIARGIPLAIPPETTPTPPDEPTTPDEPSEPEEPASVEPFELAPEQFQRLARLARAVDQGLIVAGIDLPTRRTTLRKFFREHAAHRTGRTVETLPPEFLEAVDREVERILAEHSGVIDPGYPPVVVQPPVVTVPPIIAVPTTNRPIQVRVPDRHSRWCFPWN